MLRGNKSLSSPGLRLCVGLCLSQAGQTLVCIDPLWAPGPWSSFPPGHPKPPGQRGSEAIDGFWKAHSEAPFTSVRRLLVKAGHRTTFQGRALGAENGLARDPRGEP